MRVVVDLENVIVNTNAVFIKEMNSFLSEEFPESKMEASKEDVSNWGMINLAEALAELMDWHEEILNKFFYGRGKWQGYIPITEKTWREKTNSIPVMEKDIKKKIEKLAKTVNGEIHLVTARNRVENQIRDKLSEIGIQNLFYEIVIESDKEELSYDIYIDDNPELRKKLEEQN
jgi:FMN phosphatase YigB (HAD superfamily)